jgi:hypothetical protein
VEMDLGSSHTILKGSGTTSACRSMPSNYAFCFFNGERPIKLMENLIGKVGLFIWVSIIDGKGKQRPTRKTEAARKRTKTPTTSCHGISG